MLKLGLMHAMLLDLASPNDDGPRRRRISDGLLEVLAPYDFGRGSSDC